MNTPAAKKTGKTISGKHLRKRTRQSAKKAVGFQSVRYIMSGGTAAAVDIGSYYICIHYMLHETDLDLSFFKLSYPIAALLFSYSCGFVTSFTLSKFFVFKGSEMRTRHQLIRFTVVAAAAFVMNYALMKALIIWFDFYPTLARVFTTAIVAVSNYTLHNIFTFKVKKTTKKNQAAPPMQ